VPLSNKTFFPTITSQVVHLEGAQNVCMSYHVGAKEQYQSQPMFTRIRVCLLLAMISAPSLSGADFAMKVTDKNYLDTQGFSVFLYDSTYHPVFVDQKNTAMEMILHGQRIATNGDVRLMPTPEQWDLVATLNGRQADKANNKLIAFLPRRPRNHSRLPYGR
jgi:hypothetical protein